MDKVCEMESGHGPSGPTTWPTICRLVPRGSGPDNSTRTGTKTSPPGPSTGIRIPGSNVSNNLMPLGTGATERNSRATISVSIGLALRMKTSTVTVSNPVKIPETTEEPGPTRPFFPSRLPMSSPGGGHQDGGKTGGGQSAISFQLSLTRLIIRSFRFCALTSFPAATASACLLVSLLYLPWSFMQLHAIA